MHGEQQPDACVPAMPLLSLPPRAVLAKWAAVAATTDVVLLQEFDQIWVEAMAEAEGIARTMGGWQVFLYSYVLVNVRACVCVRAREGVGACFSCLSACVWLLYVSACMQMGGGNGRGPVC